MKILILNGSPKGRRGVTYSLLTRFEQGMKNAGAITEIIHLVEMNIRQCLGCLHCWNSQDGKCVHQDDMDKILPKMRDADLMVIESPVYYNNVTSILKIFLERCMPLNSRDFCIDETGVYQHQCRYKMPPIVMFSSCGLPDRTNFDIISFYGKLLAKHWNTSVAGEVYRSESYLFEFSMPNIKILLADYNKRLVLAGEELARNGFLSEDTTRKLNRALIDSDIYVHTGDEWFLK